MVPVYRVRISIIKMLMRTPTMDTYTKHETLDQSSAHQACLAASPLWRRRWIQGWKAAAVGELWNGWQVLGTSKQPPQLACFLLPRSMRGIAMSWESGTDMGEPDCPTGTRTKDSMSLGKETDRWELVTEAAGFLYYILSLCVWDSRLIWTVSSICFRGSTNLRMVPDTSENILKIKSMVKAPLSIQMGPDMKVTWSLLFFVCTG